MFWTTKRKMAFLVLIALVMLWLINVYLLCKLLKHPKDAFQKLGKLKVSFGETTNDISEI